MSLDQITPAWRSVTKLFLCLLFASFAFITCPTPAAFSAEKFAPVARITGLKDHVNSLCWTANGRILICGSYEKVLVWSAERQETIREFERITGPVTSLALLPARRQLLVGSYQRINHFDTTTWTPQREFRGHSGQVTALQVVDDNRFLSASDDGMLKLWDLQGRRLEEMDLKAPISDMAFFIDQTSVPERQLIALTLGDETRVARPGQLVFVNLLEWKLLKEESIHRSAATSVIFSPDGNTALTGSFDETVIVTDTVTRDPVGIFRGHSRPVNCLASIPGTDLIVSGSGGRFKGKNELKIWKQSSGAVLFSGEPHQERISKLAISPDGKHLATGGYDNQVLIWDLSSFLKR